MTKLLSDYCVYVEDHMPKNICNDIVEEILRLDGYDKIPEEIMWSAPDGGMKDQLSKAIFLSFWDSKQKETLKMDLWTKEMPIDEMKTFMLQTIQSMNQTISKATGNEDLIKIIDEFSQKFESTINQDTK